MPRILIVDDEEVDRELARRSLADLEDLRIVEAVNGEDALRRLAAGPVDLILTDLRMPLLDGLELVKQLRHEAGAPPVILMTSRGSERIAVRALEAGAANYVSKRSMRSELAGVVLRVLEMEAAKGVRSRVRSFIEGCEIRFALENDPALISPMSAWIQDSLEQLGFSTAPVRSQVGIAVLEAVANAMIHGNLEIESSLRRESPEAFDALVAERRGLAPYAQRRVRCVARQSQKRVEYTISDEGNGFDPSELPDPDSPQSLHDVAGRGIHLIRTFMDSVVHNDRGTEITMSREVPDPDAPPEPPLAGSDKAAPVRGKPVR